MLIQAKVRFSNGETSHQLQPAVHALLKDGGGEWSLSDTGLGLERQISFPSFKRAWVSTFKSF